MSNGLSDPRFDGDTLTAGCGGSRMNCAVLTPSWRRPGITLLVDAQDGMKVSSYANDRLPDADTALAHYVAWQLYGDRS